MKKTLFYILVFVTLWGCSENTVKEYFDNGDLKSIFSFKNDSVLHGNCKFYFKEGGISEEKIYSDGTLKLHKAYFKTGELRYEAQMEGDLRNGVSKDYYKNGAIKVKAELLFGGLKKYEKYDSIGNKTYWYETLNEESLPKFSKDFIDIKDVTDSGFYVQVVVPGISPFQTIPIMARGDGKVIDDSKALWFIDPRQSNDSLLKIGVRIALNDTTYKILGWKEIVLSKIKGS